MSKQNPNKPFTANFQLDTKVRVIIQQVLSATIRKLSVFNQKIDKFEDYFMIYKQKIQSIQKNCQQNKQQINIQIQQKAKIKKDIANIIISSQQKQQQQKIQQNQLRDQIKQITKTIKQIHRQNESLNQQFSKTKGKFLEYSNIISSLKQQVSWKITKYIEQTANTNTQIKINNEQMKKQYFNVMLMLEKQKEKYQKIVQMNQNQENNTKYVQESINKLNEQNQLRQKQIKKTLDKLDQYDTILQAKIKNVQSKAQLKIVKLEQDSKKSIQSVKKLQSFNKQLQQIKNQQQQNKLQILKRIQQTNKKVKDQTNLQLTKINKDMLKSQKSTQKKVLQCSQQLKKCQQFLLSKIQFIKLQIQSELSSKTTQLIQQKQDSSKVNSSTMQQISSKMNKINLQIRQHVVKIQNGLKDMIKQMGKQVKGQIEMVKQQMEKKLDGIDLKQAKGNLSVSGEFGGTAKMSPELLEKINNSQMRIDLLNQSLTKTILTLNQVQQIQQHQKLFQSQATKKIDTYFRTQQQQLSNKVQKIMFLITKTRGDTIIRNDFTDKQIKQLKKNNCQSKHLLQTISKLIPAFGQCFNLIFSLIYDAQYQHSKIIQDNLPVLKKDQEKFNTCLEGVLYEYKQKKKSGIICYRHKDVKKVDIVKMVFNGYIEIWEELYEKQFKNKVDMLPKSFYKQIVEKVAGLQKKANHNDTTNPHFNTKNKRQPSSSTSPYKQSLYEKILSSNNFQPINKKTPPVHMKRLKTSDKNQQKQQFSLHSQSNIIDSLNNTLTKFATRQIAKSLKKIDEDVGNDNDNHQDMGDSNYKNNISNGNNNGNSNNGDNNQTSSSFYIRKKKTLKKEDVVVVNFPQIQ